MGALNYYSDMLLNIYFEKCEIIVVNFSMYQFKRKFLGKNWKYLDIYA